MLYIDKLNQNNKGLNSSRHLSPILRVQKKNALKKQSSVKNISLNPRVINHIIKLEQIPKKNYKNKDIQFTGQYLFNQNPLHKSKSITNYRQYCLKDENSSKNNIQTPIKRVYNSNLDLISDNKSNTAMNETINYSNFINNNKLKNKYYQRKSSLPNPIKTSREKRKSSLLNNYYCINCYNRKLMIKKNLFNNLNKSYDPNYYHKTLELKKLDEDYINNKVLENEKNQLRAFDFLKKQKDKKTNKEKLQYLYENEDNPFIGLNLQDYLYYNNKKNNEYLNNTMIDNINSYRIDKPRKAVNDYYEKVQYQIPILEKKFGPSNKYKIKYIETLKKQMSDKAKEKDDIKKLKIKTEMEENQKFSEYLTKLKNDEHRQKKLKQKMIYDNNKYLEEYLKRQNEMKKKESIDGTNAKMRKFNMNQNDYKYFINQQRINEINSLQKWINENKKQKQNQINNENNEQKRWDNYNKEFDRTYYDNTYEEKCANCNATYPIDKLYPLPKKEISS